MNTIIELHQALVEAQHQKQELRVHVVGDAGHQGDVYVHTIKSRPECWSVETTDESRQVAVGQGEGSNHRASGPVQVFWPESAEAAADACPLKGLFDGDADCLRQILGPVVVARETWTLTHPKHAHHQFPAGVYLIQFQLDRRTMRRVQD